MWAIDGDIVADGVQGDAMGGIEYEGWDHDYDEKGDQLLDYEKLEHDCVDNEDDKSAK